MLAVFSWIELIGILALVFFYSGTLYRHEKISISNIKYFSENKCSDAVLLYSFEKYISNYAKDEAMLAIGLTFSLLTLGVHLFMLITMSTFRNFLINTCNCKCLDKGTVLDERMSAIEDKVMSNLKQYLVKRLIMSKLRR